MQTSPRGRAPLAMRAGLWLVALTMIVLAVSLAACGGGGDAATPPPTVIRADETPTPDDGPTATPTPTATPAGEGYPGPEPTEPSEEPAYPSQVTTLTPGAESAYPG